MSKPKERKKERKGQSMMRNKERSVAIRNSKNKKEKIIKIFLYLKKKKVSGFMHQINQHDIQLKCAI